MQRHPRRNPSIYQHTPIIRYADNVDYLVTSKFSFDIVFKLSISFVTTYNQAPKASLEFIPIEQMVDSEATT